MHKKKRHRKNKSTGPVMMIHPLSRIPHDIALKGFVEIGKSNQEKFPLLLGKVTEILKSYDPLHIISALSMNGLMEGRAGGSKNRPYLKNKEFNQSHVELIQALALQISEDSLNATPANPVTLQTLFDVLPELGQAFASLCSFIVTADCRR